MKDLIALERRRSMGQLEEQTVNATDKRQKNSSLKANSFNIKMTIDEPRQRGYSESPCDDLNFRKAKLIGMLSDDEYDD